jgi:hypothetical protein
MHTYSANQTAVILVDPSVISSRSGGKNGPYVKDTVAPGRVVEHLAEPPNTMITLCSIVVALVVFIACDRSKEPHV